MDAPEVIMAANEIFGHEDLVVMPRNMDLRTVGNNNNNNNNNNNMNNNQAFNVRDRLFYALFFKATLAYSRIMPRWLRRFIEFFCLLKVCYSNE